MTLTRQTVWCAALAASALYGCAAQPRPDEALRAAAVAVTRADDARAADFAEADMRSAHDKLESARALAQRAAQDGNKKEAGQAGWLADEARADADLAAAKARSIRTRAAVRGLEHATGAAPPKSGE